MTEQTFLMRIDETRIPEWEADNILQNLSITANELLQGLNHVDADRSLKISPSALRALTRATPASLRPNVSAPPRIGSLPMQHERPVIGGQPVEFIQ